MTESTGAETQAQEERDEGPSIKTSELEKEKRVGDEATRRV
jgi:hypothetical protein